MIRVSPIISIPSILPKLRKCERFLKAISRENLVHQINNKFPPQFMKTKTVLSFLLFIAFASSILANQNEVITIQKIGGRPWLIKPEGMPFFAHGITHARNLSSKSEIDKFSKACKEIGFNSYGYGCPQSLRKDMPFIESWNHLVPISYYRGKNLGSIYRYLRHQRADKTRESGEVYLPT